MFGPFVFGPPVCCQLQGKDPILGTCGNVMVLLTIFIHIDGVHITTNRNWLSECVSLCFLIMRSDIVEPHLLASEPFEHTNTMIRGMQREEFLTIINKLHIIWTTMAKGNVKP